MTERARKNLRGIAAAGILLTLLGWVMARERISPGVLLAGFYVLGLGLAGLLFIAFAYVTQARWSAAIRRVPEAFAATLPLGAAIMIVALAGLPWLYEWTHSHDHLLQKKAAWLNTGFFLARAAAYLVIWLVFAALMRRIPAADRGRRLRLSALFIVVFAITFSLACFDWIMSIEAHWFSTVFAIYNLSGLFLSGLAAITMVAIFLRRAGALSALSDDHLHDLGKLTFGFATFWAYIWFCQYMLIWYGNMPEETVYYVRRATGAWGVLSVVNPVVNWLIPFLILLPRPAKRNESVLLWVAMLLLVGRWLDLYIMIYPSFLPESPRIGLWELGPSLAGLALIALAVFRAFGRGSPVPDGDPHLAESLRHRT